MSVNATMVTSICLGFNDMTHFLFRSTRAEYFDVGCCMLIFTDIRDMTMYSTMCLEAASCILLPYFWIFYIWVATLETGHPMLSI
jgi:hypothetical protein